MKKDPFHSDNLYLNFSEKHPWAFEKLGLANQINDHLLYVGQQTKAALLRYIMPGVYNTDLLDKYKDFHISTFPLEIQNGAATLLSVWFQLDNQQIIQANLVITDEYDTNFSATVVLHTSLPKHFINFLKDNKEFRIISPSKKAVGFPG